ncbi:MAG: helix-turn-helix transcriptional regulator [Crocinitomicaceae bacterium]|nr:helix-turn-helix transcriptional regulator [Flavobacteriales bacterium]NQZ36640.1 helix-turn-helix transcriptional regulator [Crocinitomicaceae bacterium]PHR32518.1 MAG: transcriptional regulator [Fluviicola sp.]
MEDDKNKECDRNFRAVADAMDVFRGKWKIKIIAVLIHYEKLGFQDLLRTVEGITPKMLSKELKDLQVNLLLTKTVIETRPATVEYAITEYGKTCEPVILALYAWGENHRKTIIESFDKQSTLVSV